MIADIARRSIRNVFVPLLIAALVGVGHSQATFEDNPFFEHTEALLRAHGVEMLSARLVGIEALASSEADELDDDDLGEVIEALEVDFRRFAATLEASDAGLADNLEKAIEAIEDASEDGDRRAIAESARLATGLAEEARTVLIGNMYEENPAFTAAVMATMLTTENGGIGEGYEEAVEGEVGPYAVGWAGLARVRVLWSQLEPLATDNQRFEVEDMLAELDALFPGPRPGPELARSDPEEAEGATQRIGGFLEEIVNADLFPSRDLGRLLARTRDLSVQACEAYAASEQARGLELISNAAFVYGEYLGNTLALFSPEAAEEVAELYDALAPGAMGEEEGGDEGEAEESDAVDDEAEPLVGDDAHVACNELVEQLETAGGPFGI
jgi:hypothetical protein